jgi:hypothetical protein
MILILVAIIAASAIAVALLRYSRENYDGIGTMAGVLGFLLAMAAALAAALVAVAYAFAG